jgi:hypothetical protein
LPTFDQFLLSIDQLADFRSTFVDVERLAAIVGHVCQSEDPEIEKCFILVDTKNAFRMQQKRGKKFSGLQKNVG